MSGGTYEFVASYCKNGESEVINNGISFTKKISDKFSTVYDVYSTVHYDYNTIKNTYKYGDGTLETDKWESSTLEWVSIKGPFFVRGGANNQGSGLFSSNQTGGIGKGTAYVSGFRIAIIM